MRGQVGLALPRADVHADIVPAALGFYKPEVAHDAQADQQFCRVHPARAPDHMSASAGYAALNEENPWGPLVEQIEALAKGFEIPVVEPTLADGRAQGTRDYLADLQARLETHRKDRDLLEKQSSKTQVIVTFLAILELMKTGEIRIFQEHILMIYRLRPYKKEQTWN